MKKIMMTLAAVLCCAMTTTVVNAQEAESVIKEGERLAKAADDAPQDWKKQYDAAEFYLNESKAPQIRYWQKSMSLVPLRLQRARQSSAIQSLASHLNSCLLLGCITKMPIR